MKTKNKTIKKQINKTSIISTHARKKAIYRERILSCNAQQINAAKHSMNEK